MHHILLSILLLAFALFPAPDTSGGGGKATSKIGGVSLVAPSRAVDDSWVEPVQKMGADWVAVLPYGYSQIGQPDVRFNLGMQWWGERIEGMTEIIRHAKSKGLKVMLKPMVWIPGSWPGDFRMETEEGWKKWEKQYALYIVETAKVAAKEGVDMFCIGTEYKVAVRERPEFWRKLIAGLRTIYKGPLTYAANWDNFQKVAFWDDLDYIGIDGYFPLSPKSTPGVKELKSQWETPLRTIELLQGIFKKPILFTEFGYRSTDACTWRQWEIQNIPYNQKVNLKSQENAYQAFFESFWEKEWFAGVFLWQWYANNAHAGGNKNSDYTPQNKPAAKIISEWFAKDLEKQPGG